jgi:hypothetical protein
MTVSDVALIVFVAVPLVLAVLAVLFLRSRHK